MDETVSHGVGISLVTNWITWPKRSWLINFTELHEYHFKSQSINLLWMFGELWILSLGRGRVRVPNLVIIISKFKINSDTSDTLIYPIICSTYCKIEITVPFLFRNSWLTSPVYLYNETQNKIKAKTNIV